MNNNLMMNPDEVRTSGNTQKDIAQNFNSAVQNIFSTIESMCASDWKGFSSETYMSLTSSYREDMRKLGEIIDSHGSKDIESANRLETTDEELAGMASRL